MDSRSSFSASKRYWIVRLNGGLGNQMCDFAAGLKNSLEIGAELMLDLSGIEALNLRGIGTPREFGLHRFRIYESGASILGGVSGPVTLRLIRKSGFSRGQTLLAEVATHVQNFVRPGTVLRMNEIAFNESFYGGNRVPGKWHYISGLHLSFKYFDSIKQELVKIFTPSEDISSNLAEVQKLAMAPGSTAVHVRRGDYVTSRSTERKKVTSEAYFRKGIEIASRGYSNPQIIFFSDDIDWCIERFGDIRNATFVVPEEGEPEAHHLFVMSKAENFVISNSSFSWWAAYLSTRIGKRVVTPSNWMVDGSYPMQDLIPSTWKSLA